MTLQPADNTLFYGDNLDVMRKYIKDETVDLCYIDPPFNSKRNYNQIYNNIGSEDRAQAQAFVDTWTWDSRAIEDFQQILSNEGGRFTRQTIELIKSLHRILGAGSLVAYLVSMTLRITEIRRVLKSTGSFYLHCDPTSSHYLKLLLDSIFVAGGGEFQNEIIWKRYGAHNDVGQGSHHFGRVHDVILFYTKKVAERPVWNQVFTPLDKDYIEREYRSVEPETGRRFTTSPMTGPGGAAKGNPVFDWKGHTRAWRFSKASMARLEQEGRLYYSRTGYVRQKMYLDEAKGIPVQDLWSDIGSLSGTHAERLGYPTQKPLALLERIIQASSNPGDLVLDAYCGCGTTIAAAEHLNRKWIGIDITYQSIALVLKRLEEQEGKDIVQGIVLNGIPGDMASAEALAHKRDDRLRKEFEKWAVLTYTNNRAVINDKKGGDEGIDGTAYFLTGPRDNAKMVFQVKSGAVGRGEVSKLNNDRTREGAEMAVFLTLQPSTLGMRKEANASGTYDHELMGRSYPRIQIVTIQEILEQHKRLEIPMTLDVLKLAQVVARGEQTPLFDVDHLLTPSMAMSTASTS